MFSLQDIIRVTLLFVLVCGVEAAAQVPFPEPDCGSGELFDDGVCRDVRVVLSKTGTLYWVDQRSGSDSNPGTESRPWKTISRSTRDGVLRPGDAVLVRAGTYREEVRPQEGGSESGGATKYVTFAAYPGETATVSGADVVNRPGQGYNGWKRQSDGSWRHAWVWPTLRSEGTYDVLRRRELFVDNGGVLSPQGGESRPALQNGEFWVEGPDSGPLAVYLKTSNGGDPNEHTVEVGIRNQLFYNYGEGDSSCGGVNRGYYRLIGLRFTHATTKRQRMAVCPGKRGSLLKGVEVVWNNAGGVKLVGNGHTVQNSDISDNGIEGVGGTNCSECTVEYSEISRNHWKWDGDSRTAHGGGGKWTHSSNNTFRHNRYVLNGGSSVWMDGHSNYNEVYGNYIDRSQKQGIQIEQESDYNRIHNNVVVRTRYDGPIWNGVGISISTSDHNLVAYNTLMRNDGIGVRVGGDNRGDATHATIYNNLFVDNIRAADEGGQRLREIQITGNGPSNGATGVERVESHRLDGNAYWSRSGRAYADFATFMVSPAPAYDGNLYTHDLGEWQGAGLGYDPNGMVADLSLPTVVDPTDVEDGWLIGAGSQYIGRAVALPDGVDPILTDFFGSSRPAVGGAVGAYHVGGGLRPVEPLAGTLGESGSVTIRQRDASEWHAVAFAQPFADPVVVVGPLSYEGTDPASVRVRRVTSTGFEVQVDEWDYLDGAHTEETFSYLAVEAGSHVLQDGTRLVAKRLSAADHGWRSVVYGETFGAVPVVLAQVSSDDGPSAVVPRLRSVTASGFQLSLQEEEANDDQHTDEAVGYVAIEPSQDVTDGIRAGFKGGVTDQASEIQYGGTFSVVPSVFATIQTTNGTDPAALRYTESTEGGVTVFVEEERSADEEVNHASETVGFLALNPGLLIGTPSTDAALKVAPALSIAEERLAFRLDGAFPNPFTGRTTIRYSLGETAPVRLDVYDAIGRRVAVLRDGEEEAAGPHEVTFDGTSLPSGVYVYRIQAGAFTETLRMTLAGK